MAKLNLITLLIVALALPAAAQASGPPMPGTLSADYPGKAYSPYASAG